MSNHGQAIGLEVQDRLTYFENAARDPKDIVLVTRGLSRQDGPSIVSGEIICSTTEEGERILPSVNGTSLVLAPAAILEGMTSREDVAGNVHLQWPRQLLIGRGAVSAYLDVLGSQIVTSPTKEGDPVLVDKFGLGEAAEIKGLLDDQDIDIAGVSPELAGVLDQYKEQGRERAIRMLRHSLVGAIRDEKSPHSIDWDRAIEEKVLFSRALTVARVFDATDAILPTIDSIDKFYAARAQGEVNPYLCFPQGLSTTEKYRRANLRYRLKRALSENAS